MLNVIYIRYIDPSVSETDINNFLTNFPHNNGTIADLVKRIVILYYPKSITRYCKLIVDCIDAYDKIKVIENHILKGVVVKLSNTDAISNLITDDDEERNKTLKISNIPHNWKEFHVRGYIRKDLSGEQPAEIIIEKTNEHHCAFVRMNDRAAAQALINAQRNFSDKNNIQIQFSQMNIKSNFTNDQSNINSITVPNSINNTGCGNNNFNNSSTNNNVLNQTTNYNSSSQCAANSNNNHTVTSNNSYPSNVVNGNAQAYLPVASKLLNNLHINSVRETIAFEINKLLASKNQ